MNRENWIAMLPFYLLVVIFAVGVAGAGSRVVTVVSQNMSIAREYTFVIDAGHGYPDGGATSCTGVLESTINLQIAKRLDDLLHFLGFDTRMVRTNEESVYTEGESIGAKKVSDLKNRVQMVMETENAVLVSIHQNTFPDSRYGGPQVLYASNEESRELGSRLQNALKNAVDPPSRRTAKKASGVYLMEHVDCVGVLVECGFISNPEDEAKLLNAAYQNQLCCVIAASLCSSLYS